jgi:hypothetical protein
MYVYVFTRILGAKFVLYVGELWFYVMREVCRVEKPFRRVLQHSTDTEISVNGALGCCITS